MNIFGVGGAELLAILIIMLVFAGPKRMIHWSYVLGQHVAKFRVIWSQTVDLVQKEFDDAGVGIQIPKEPPTRSSINKAISDTMKPVSQPIQQSLDEVKKDVGAIKDLTDTLQDKKPKTAAAAKPVKPQPPAKPAPPAKPPQPTQPPVKPAPPAQPTQPAEAANLGSWSGAAAEANAGGSNGSAADLGTWSSKAAGE